MGHTDEPPFRSGAAFATPLSPYSGDLTISPASTSSQPLSAPLVTNFPCLPSPTPISEPHFIWGTYSPSEFSNMLTETYQEFVRWRKNLFSVPYGKSGKQIVAEFARWIRVYAGRSCLESVALSAVCVACVLLLQRPQPRSKPSDHSDCLLRHLNQWKDGLIDQLLLEGRTIQKRLPPLTNKPRKQSLARNFANLIFRGKVKDAIRLLCDREGGKVLQVDDHVTTSSGSSTVFAALKEKHPSAQPSSPGSIISLDNPPKVHPVIFDALDAKVIRSTALHTFGSGGPTDTDAHCWRRMCSAFCHCSDELCHTLAMFARRLCTDVVNPSGHSTFLSQ